MKPEEFKQNVKDRVRVFEDGGIRLLKKGKRGIVRAIFGRTGLVLALFFVQVLLLLSVFRWFTALVPHLLGGSIEFTAVMVIYLLNSKMDNSAKITWLVVIALVPVLAWCCSGGPKAKSATGCSSAASSSWNRIPGSSCPRMPKRWNG